LIDDIHFVEESGEEARHYPVGCIHVYRKICFIQRKLK